jgi:hypothetical protein
MIDLTNPTPRRAFLGQAAGGAAALGLAGLATPMELAATQQQAAQAKEDPALTAWLGKIKGKHRQVYDMPEVNSGFGLAWSRIFYVTNNETGVPDSDISVVAVLRHGALPLALTDQAWAKYKLGEVFKINDPKTNAPSVRNIFYKTAAGELPLPGMDITDLLKTGVLFGACNMAIKFYSGMVAKNTKGNADTIANDWRAAVIPGIQIVPSGVWAVNRAQEHQCSYCFAG